MPSMIPTKGGSASSGKPVIFYHSNCLDGFGGAWAAWKKFKSTAEYRPLNHEQRIVPERIAGRDIFFVDYCFPAPIMKAVKKKASSLTIIDHHVSHKDVLNVANFSSFSLHKSGCVLAWHYFHPGKKIPRLLLTIQDIDLFTLKLPKTQEICAALMLYDFDFAQWDRLIMKFEDSGDRKNLEFVGSFLLKYKDQYITRLMETAEPVLFEGYKSYAVNTHIFYSEIGSTIYQTKGVHLGITWYYKGGKIKVSLRSDGSIDTSKIAQKYGGGGHVGASGFWIDHAARFPWRVRKGVV